MKVKIFKKTGKYFPRKKPTIMEELELEINSWLEDNGDVEIKDIKQSCCGGSLEPSITVVSIWYA